MDAPTPPISLRDLARRLELSPMVVSAILRERESTVRFQPGRVAEVRAAAQAHGYRPNNDVGVLVHRRREDANLVQYEVADGVVEHVAATQNGKGRVVTELVVPGAVPDLVREWRVGGVVLLGDAEAEAALVPVLRAKGIAYAVANPAGASDGDTVAIDDAAGAAMVAEDFHRRGCHRGVLMLPAIGHRAGAARREAFAARCRELGLACELIDETRFAHASERLLTLAAEPGDSGLFTLAEWWLAASSLLAAAPGIERGCWHGVALRNTLTPWSHQPPQLRLPYAEMGAAAVDMLYRKWALRESRQPDVILVPHLS